ncbi:hypothetical protein Hanom_Chr04g00341231 [Helianthus anomalus]
MNVLMVFESSLEAGEFRSSAPGFGWFHNLEIWKGQSLALERIAWLNIHGVPLHLAKNEVFDSIGRTFGKVILASQIQPEDNKLTYDCVGILTNNAKKIEEEVVTWDSNKFTIWVEERRGEWFPDFIEDQENYMKK